MKNGTILDSIASYSCTKGHDIKGDHDRTCLMDGTWSGNETICKAITLCIAQNLLSVPPSQTEVSFSQLLLMLPV